MRVLIAVTHLLGAGHLTRSAAIGRALAEAGHEVCLVSGGMPNPLVNFTGLAVVQLPPVRAVVGDFTTLRDEIGAPIDPARLRARRAALFAALTESRPDVVVTELYPFGRRVLAGEFNSLIESAATLRPRPLVAASIRDILAPPSRPESAAQAGEFVRRSYAAVLVHGDERLVPLDASWPVDAELRRKLVYTGYVDPAGPVACDQVSDLATGDIVVSGGSSAAALPLYRAALTAASAMPERRWRLLIGPGAGPGAVAELASSAPSNAFVEPGRADFRELVAKAAVLVSQAGYNTVMDIVATGARAVLAPFETGGETEQRLRAEALAKRGIASLVPESDLTGPSLEAAVKGALRRPRPELGRFRLDGAAVAARALEQLRLGRDITGAPARTTP